jgi:hypothetical protein
MRQHFGECDSDAERQVPQPEPADDIFGHGSADRVMGNGAAGSVRVVKLLTKPEEPCRTTLR